jgi:PEP-CTERM motif-containing protein
MKESNRIMRIGGISSKLLTGAVVLATAAWLTTSSVVQAAPVPESPEASQYLLVARMSINGEVLLQTSNFELGANKAPVPSTDDFLDSGGGPTLLGAVPDLPANAKAVFQGIGGNGNLAVTDPDGFLNLQDVGVYADPNIGIRLAAPNDSFNQTSNSFFNDPNMFPNTFDTGTQTGVNVNPNDADQNTRIDPTGGGNPSANTGVTFGYDHTGLDSELASLRTEISGLTATNTLIVSGGNAGELETSSTIGGAGGASIAFGASNSLGGVSATITIPSGLNVIDVVTGSNDFLLNNANLVIDGPSDAFAIFRTIGSDNMGIENSNVLAGLNIGMNNILFYTDQLENDTHFNMNNTIINGAAFWSLGSSDIAEININNAQGCTQLIAEDINLDDVRFTRCVFNPEPTSLMVFGLGMVAVSIRRR